MLSGSVGGYQEDLRICTVSEKGIIHSEPQENEAAS